MSEGSEYERGYEAGCREFLGAVDDCDRALEVLYSTADINRISTGLETLRRSLISRLEGAGLYPYGRVGDEFKAAIHEAVAAEDGQGATDVLGAVHRRGWMREDGSVVQVAQVSVRRALAGEEESA